MHSTRSRKWSSLPVACWWSVVVSGYSAFSTTKTGRHDLAEKLLKVASNTKNQSIIIFHLLKTVRIWSKLWRLLYGSWNTISYAISACDHSSFEFYWEYCQPCWRLWFFSRYTGFLGQQCYVYNYSWIPNFKSNRTMKFFTNAVLVMSIGPPAQEQ